MWAGAGRRPLTSRCRRPARSSSCSRLCSSSSRRPLCSSRGRSWDARGAPEPPPAPEGQGRGMGPGWDQFGEGGARETRATAIGPRAGGGAARPPDSAGAGSAREAAAPSPRTDSAPPSRARFPAFRRPGPRGRAGEDSGLEPAGTTGPSPASSVSRGLPPGPQAPSRPLALTAAAPAPGRPALELPLPGRPTRASEHPRRRPAARVARAAAGSRASAPPTAWRERAGAKAEVRVPYPTPKGKPQETPAVLDKPGAFAACKASLSWCFRPCWGLCARGAARCRVYPGLCPFVRGHVPGAAPPPRSPDCCLLKCKFCGKSRPAPPR